jgi:hypothetical protein
MSRYCVFLSPRTLRALVFISAMASFSDQAATATQEVGSTGSRTALHWQSPARFHHGVKSTRGNLIFTANGIEFRSEPRLSHRWSFTEVKTLELSPQRLVLTDYENRGHYLSGTRHFDFDVQEPVPPAVAEELANRVGEPVVNEDPEAKTDSRCRSNRGRHGYVHDPRADSGARVLCVGEGAGTQARDVEGVARAGTGGELISNYTLAGAGLDRAVIVGRVAL